MSSDGGMQAGSDDCCYAECFGGWVTLLLASWLCAFLVCCSDCLFLPLFLIIAKQRNQSLSGLLRHYPLNFPITRSKWRFNPNDVASTGAF